jgi:hypothetical protein
MTRPRVGIALGLRLEVEGPGLGFSGAFAAEPRPQVAATFLAAARALLAAAFAVERRRLR